SVADSGAGFTAAGSYAYDAALGLKASESLPLALGGAASSSYAYSDDRRLSGATVGGVSGAYAFAPNGNLSLDTEGALTTTFTYDAASRLTQSSDGATTTVYGWNAANGWRTSQSPAGTPNQVQYTYTKS